MLEATVFDAEGRRLDFFTSLRSTEDVPPTLLFWMAEEAARLLELGAFFYAGAIMCQIPGGAYHQFVGTDDADPTMPALDDDPIYWVKDGQPALDVLAECLIRLGVPQLLQQIPGSKGRQPRKLSQKWLDWLERHARFNDGLLNVVGACLDTLIIQPAAEDADALRRRWQLAGYK